MSMTLTRIWLIWSRVAQEGKRGASPSQASVLSGEIAETLGEDLTSLSEGAAGSMSSVLGL